MTDTLVHRLTLRFDLPLPEGESVLHPEKAVLQFSHHGSLDIGALCYLEREFSIPVARRLGRKVVLNSLSVQRVELIRTLIEHISVETRRLGLSAGTMRDRFSRLVVFVSWADANSWPDVLAGSAQAKPALKAYLKFLQTRVSKNEISLNSGARQQETVVAALAGFLQAENLVRGLKLLRKDECTIEATRIPSNEAQAQVLSLCESLFNGLSQLILEQKSFPFALTMPAYLGIADDRLWIFPTNSWLNIRETAAQRNTHAGYNYLEGRLSTLDEISKVLPKERGKRPDVALRTSCERMAAANADGQHISRRQIAARALKAYIMLFLANTGMNWAQLCNLSWSDDFEIGVAHQAFRAIKCRAQGKLVSFELPISAIPSFKRFLELRKYLLNGDTSEYLFFNHNDRSIRRANRLGQSELVNTYKMLKRIDPKISEIQARQWRVAKSDWLIRNTDPATAALVLQNTEKTVLASYAEGSESRHIEEMGGFLGQISDTFLPSNQEVKGAVTSAVGICTSFGEPKKIDLEIVVQPDCKAAEGCLFCDKYRAHADERDTRKLLSCRHCLRKIEPLIGSEERIQSLLVPALARIQKILEEIARRDQKMVERVQEDVDEKGELDPYWARKLQMLMELGVVN